MVATGEVSRSDAERAIRSLLEQRDEGKTICPSEAARELGGDDGFRELMDTVRAAARKLVAAGELGSRRAARWSTSTRRRAQCGSGSRADEARNGPNPQPGCGDGPLGDRVYALSSS